MIMHLHPELVHDDRLASARDNGVVDIEAWREEGNGYVHGTRTFYDAVQNSDNGVFGDQTGATPEKGAELFEAATEQLVALADWIADRPLDDLVARPQVTDYGY